MFRYLTFATILVLAVNTADAQAPQFPYEAIVDAEEVYVRSGPGKSFYPTGKLKQGNKVKVVRHDPGGWYQIEPPAGSFSWIPTEFVDLRSGNRGRVRANCFTRIGSEFGDDANDVLHRILAGEEVEIIGRKTLQIDRGQVDMYKILPPKTERRTIPGSAIVVANEAPIAMEQFDPFGNVTQQQTQSPSRTPTAQTQNPADPFNPVADFEAFSQQSQQQVGQNQLEQFIPQQRDSIEVGQTAPIVEQDTPKIQNQVTDKPAVVTQQAQESESPGPSREEIQADTLALKKLDEQFKTIIDQQDKSRWEFAELERGYTELKESAVHPAMAAYIDQRFDALTRYKERKREYMELLQITSQTDARDAQLLSLQQQTELQAEQTPTPQNPAVQGPAEQQPVIPSPMPQNLPPAISGPINSTQQIPSLQVSPPGAPAPHNPMSSGPEAQSPMPQVTGPVIGQPGSRPGEQPPLPTNSPSSGQPTTATPPRQFAGAGIVQQSALTYRGAPRHVLVAPNGRILTYLYAPPNTRLNLDQYRGIPMGIHGQRSYRPELRADLIIVNGLTPVRLKPQVGAPSPANP